MKTCGLYIALFLLLLAAKLSGQNVSDPLQRLISVSESRISKSHLLTLIEEKYGIFFSYNPEFIGATDTIDVNHTATPLAYVLNELFDFEIISVKAVGNQVVFTPKGQSTWTVAKTPDYFVVKGKIFDNKKVEGLPYCNIAISGQSIGTMSNLDGFFQLKIPHQFLNDSIRFSCIGFHTEVIPVSSIDGELEVVMRVNTIQLKPIDVNYFNPAQVLDSFILQIPKNYPTAYVLQTNYYREVIKQNNAYTDVSEAVLEILKAPYDNEYRSDHVKFVKGRRSADVSPYSMVKLRMKGGPFYANQLDVVKTRASFLFDFTEGYYKYSFNRSVLLNDRETIVIDFQPLTVLRELLYKGRIYIDRKTWALVRVEFEMTREGMRAARSMLIEKEPRTLRAVPTQVLYVVNYQFDGLKWYFLSAKNEMHIRIDDRQRRQRTRFHNITELLTTRIDDGDFQAFSRRDIFRSNEFITEKIDSVDLEFWRDYNIIEPEDELVEAISGFDNFNLIIQQIKP